MGEREARLAAKVKAVNNAHQYALEIFPLLITAMLPFKAEILNHLWASTKFCGTPLPRQYLSPNAKNPSALSSTAKSKNFSIFDPSCCGPDFQGPLDANLASIFKQRLKDQA